MNKPYKTVIAILALSLAALHGCGGGGGGGGGSGSGDTTQPTPEFVTTQIDTAGIEPAFVQVAFNETGQAVVLWRQLVFLDTTLFANLFDPVSGWGPAQKVSSAPSIVVDSQLSMDGNGDVVVIWDETGSPPRRIVANTLISGVAGNTHTIGDGLGGERVAAGVSGAPVAVALWEDNQSTSSQDSLRSAEYRIEIGWTPVVSLPGTKDVGDAYIATLDDGRRLVVWSTSGELRFNLWSPGVGWVTSASVTSSAQISVLTVPYLVSGANGTALSVWIEGGPEAAEYTLFGAWFDGSAWGPATPLSTQTGIIIGRDSVRVAADKQGNAVVVWSHVAGDPNDSAALRSVRYRNGAWEAPIALSDLGSALNLAVNAAGDTVVVYTENKDVTARGFTAANPAWGDPVKITEFPLRGGGTGVALEPDGSLVVVWIKRPDGTLWSSRGRIQ